jgi:hypothetical protein
LGLFDRFFGNKSKQKVIRLPNPKFGQFNCFGNEIEKLIQEDCDTLAPLFNGKCVLSSEFPPKCDVIFIYAKFRENGQIVGTTLSWREIIRDSGAKVAVFAINNVANSYLAASDDPGYGHANFVLTIDRRGELFLDFYKKLFTKMFKGKSMPVAWVDLAPQIPGENHEDCPDSIFACELGQVTFG